MKKRLLFLTSIILVSMAQPVVAQEDNSKRISEIEAQIKDLQAELKKLKGEEDSKFYKIGDVVEVGPYTLKLLSVEYTNERNQFEDVNPDKVLLIKYEITNNSDKDESFFSSNWKLFVDNKEMKSYPVGSDLGTVNAGRTVESTASFAIIGDGNSYELEWTPTFNLDNIKGLWKIVP